jgi:uncharacterized membrane protein
LEQVFQFGQLLDIPRVVLASVLVFFAPGFAWTLVLFKQINVMERVVLSLALSIALVTLSILVLNAVFKVGINGLSAVVIIILITVIPLVWYGLRRFLAR